MSALTSGQKTYARKFDHSSQMYLAVLVPADVFTATVTNNEARGATVIEYGSVVGTDANALAGQIIWFGSTAGARDIGTARIKSINAGGNVVTIEENDLDLAAGNHITCKKMWLPRVKLPAIDTSGADVSFTKDGDAYTNQNTNIPPVVVIGPPDCQFINSISGVATCRFVDELSHSLVGATLSTKTWNYDGGSLTGGSGTVAAPYVVTYAAAGTYWVRLSITDSNGANAIGYRPVFIFDDDHPPYIDFAAGPRRNTLQGTRQQFEVFGDAAQTDLPDLMWVVRFNRDWYGGTETSLDTRYPFRGHVKYSGFLLSDTLTVADDMSSISFETIDITQWLNLMPGFGNVLKERATPATWMEMATLNAIKAVYWLLKWHTTALEICDLRYSLALASSEIRMREQRWGKGSLLQQCNLVLNQKGIFADLCATVQGGLEIRQDPSLMKTADRAGNVTTVLDLAQTDFYSVDLVERPRQQVQNVRISGFTFDGTTATPLMAKAPGVPADALQEPQHDGLILSPTDGQSGANRLAGDLAAKYNNREPNVRISLVGNWDVFDAALQERVTFPLAAADNIRGLIYSASDYWLVREVSVNEDVAGGFVEGIDLILEHETDGVDGVTVNIPAPGDDDWPSPPPPSNPARPEPVPVVDPIISLSDYVASTDAGVYGIDLADSGQIWRPYNAGLSGDALYVWDFKLDPWLFDSQQRVWIITKDGICRMDYFPLGTWTQVISLAALGAAGMDISSGRCPNRARLNLSSEVEHRYAAVFWNQGSGVNARQYAAVFNGAVISNLTELYLTNDGCGWGDILFAPHGAGLVVYVVGNRAPGHAGSSEAKLWKSVDGGGSYSLLSTLSVNDKGLVASVSVPYVSPSNPDLYVYWGRGGAVATPGLYRKSVNAGASFTDMPNTAGDYIKLSAGISQFNVFLANDELDSAPTKYSVDGGVAWQDLPLFTDASPAELDLTCAYANWRGNVLAAVVQGGSNPDYLVLHWTAENAGIWTNQTRNLADYGVTTVHHLELVEID